MYKIIESKIKLEGKEKTVYGLQHNDGTRVENISADKLLVERLAEYYTQKNVSPLTLRDVVLDMLNTEKGLEV